MREILLERLTCRGQNERRGGDNRQRRDEPRDEIARALALEASDRLESRLVVIVFRGEA